MKKNSWDIFDTLIGRKCGTALRLFEQMGRDLNEPEFVSQRQAAERSLQKKEVQYTLTDIYNEYGNLFHLKPVYTDEMRELEWALERQNVFPIKRYAKYVEPGDLLVSDMYLTPTQMFELLEIAGIPPGELYVSCYGKHSGKVWGPLKDRITQHCGDNPHGDIAQAKKAGIRTLRAATEMLPAETAYLKTSPDIAWWVRWHRLQNIVSEGDEHFRFCQIEYNAPMLVAAAHSLRDYVRENNVKKLLFMARDCQLFQKVWQQLYSDIPSEYLYISRDCLRSGSESFFSYLNSRYVKGTALVDLAASGGSLKIALPRLANPQPQLWAVLFLPQYKINFEHKIATDCAISTKQVPVDNTTLEMLNYADHWHVRDVDAAGLPIFDEQNAYDMSLVQDGQRLIESMLPSIPGEPDGVDLYPILKESILGIDQEKKLIKKLFPKHFEFEKKQNARFVTVAPVAAVPKESDVVIVGAIEKYKWQNVDLWLRSLRLAGYSGEVHLLCYDVSSKTRRQLQEEGVFIHERPKTRFQVVVQRFADLSLFMDSFAEDTWVVFPDVGDIVFQYNPADFLKSLPKETSIVVASEGIHFSGNSWVRENLQASFPAYWDALKDQWLFNAGSMAARAGILRELAKGVFKLCLTRPACKNHDQAALNILLREPRYQDKTLFTKAMDRWCFCAASSLYAKPGDREGYLESLPTILRGRCLVGENQPTCMFHQYTRSKKMAQEVRRYYEGLWRKRK